MGNVFELNTESVSKHVYTENITSTETLFTQKVLLKQQGNNKLLKSIGKHWKVLLKTTLTWKVLLKDSFCDYQMYILCLTEMWPQ